jgi:hypothetical protein
LLSRNDYTLPAHLNVLSGLLLAWLRNILSVDVFWWSNCSNFPGVFIFWQIFPGAINSNYNVAISIHLRPHANILYLFFFWQHFKHVSFVF